MDDKMINAVKNWLEAIMPAVVETLVANLTVEALHEMGKEEGIHGPIAVNLEEFRAPITAIDMFLPISEFAETIANEEHVQQLVTQVLEQYKNLAA